MHGSHFHSIRHQGFWVTLSVTSAHASLGGGAGPHHMAAHAACKAGYHALLLLLGLAAASLCAAGENRSSRL